jgi:hypothetical protein
MPLLSPRFLALPAAALAVIIALAQAHPPAEAGSEAAAVQRVTNCAAAANTLVAACALAENTGVTVTR